MHPHDPIDEMQPATPGTLDRREFLKRVGGGVVVLFTTLPRFALAEASPTPLPSEPAFNAYLRIGEDGRVMAFGLGKLAEGTTLGAARDEMEGIRAALERARRGVTPRELAGHCDVAPGRKTDPGPAFNWLRLYDALGKTAEKRNSCI